MQYSRDRSVKAARIARSATAASARANSRRVNQPIKSSQKREVTHGDSIAVQGLNPASTSKDVPQSREQELSFAHRKGEALENSDESSCPPFHSYALQHSASLLGTSPGRHHQLRIRARLPAANHRRRRQWCDDYLRWITLRPEHRCHERFD